MRVSKPTVQVFVYEQDSDDEKATITIRQGTVADISKRTSVTVQRDSETSNLTVVNNSLEDKLYDIWLVLTKAENIKDDKGKELFPNGGQDSGMLFAKFKDKLAALPDLDFIDWCHECVLNVNPQWDNDPNG